MTTGGTFMKKKLKYTSIVVAALLAVTPFIDSVISETSMNENTVLATTKSKKKSHISKKSKKSKKTKKMSASTIYKKLFGKKSGNSTIEKYRNKIIKVAQKYVRLNGGLNPSYIKYMFYFKANNKNSTIYSFDYDENDAPFIKVKEKASDDPVEAPQYLIDDSVDDSAPESVLDVQKFKGKYYYVITDDDLFYPVNQWKPALKKFE